jgi:glycerophosphoryl diester phosphodiesterase
VSNAPQSNARRQQVLPNRTATRVVAHRGASGTLAEHTLAAYKLAVDQGADALECDVRLTADGHLVCVHDRRVDRTSNGRGVVSTLELAQLSELDFGSWKAGRGAAADSAADSQVGSAAESQVDSAADSRVGSAIDPDEADWADVEHTSVLTLERLLEFATTCGRRIELAIETKHPTRYAGLVERKLLELLHRFDLVTPADGERTPVRIMSFSQLSLRRVRELAPAIPTVFLMERVPLRFRDGSLPHGARIAGPGIDLVRANPGYVAALHRAGQRVHVWTVDDPEDVELCLRLGVDTIITNHPRRVLDQLGR